LTDWENSMEELVFNFLTLEFLKTAPGQAVAVFLLCMMARWLLPNIRSWALRCLAIGTALSLQLFFTWYDGLKAPYYILALFNGILVAFASMQAANFAKPYLKFLTPRNGDAFQTPPQGTPQPNREERK